MANPPFLQGIRKKYDSSENWHVYIFQTQIARWIAFFFSPGIGVEAFSKGGGKPEERGI